MEGYALGAPWYHAADMVDLEVAWKGGFERIRYNGTLSQKDLALLCGWLEGVDKEKLEGLQLPTCFLKRREMTRLIESLSRNHSLKFIELSFHTSFDSEKWNSFAQYLQQNEMLLVLSVNWSDHASKLIDSLCEGLKQNKSIQDLRLRDSSLGSHGSNSLAQMLQTNVNLRKLTLSGVRLSEHGAKRICDALKGNTRIEILDLSENSIGPQGAASLRDVLAEASSKIRCLNLRFNRLRNAGAAIIGEALEVNNTLTWLDLTNNGIKGKGVEAVAIKLANNLSLIYLGMRQNFTKRQFSSSQRHMLRIQSAIRRNKARSAEASTPLDASESAEWHSGKLMVVGASGGGKTALIRSLMGRQFNPDLSNTVGIEMEPVLTEDGNQWKADTSPTLAGQFRRRLQEERHLQEFNASLTHGNTRQAEEHGLLFSIWDYAGQKVFHTVHHMFMTKLGIYVVTFSIAEYIRREKRTVAYLRFWLNSINIHAADAPVVVVATHAEGIEPDAFEGISAELENITTDMHNIVRAEDGSILFQVDNKTATGIVTLRDVLSSEFKKQDYATRKVRLNWVEALDAMRAQDGHYIDTGAVHAVMKEHGISSPGEVRRALELFHELGLLFHDTNAAGFQGQVVLDTDWLVDQITHVIRDRIVHPIDFAEGARDRGIELERRALQRIENQMQGLFDGALATRSLLDFLWQNDSTFMMDIMEAQRFMSKWLWAADDVYVVPAMAKSLGRAQHDQDKAAAVFDTFPETPLAVFEFEYLPTGVFERLVSGIIQRSVELQAVSTTELPVPVVYRDAAKVYLHERCALYLATDKVRLAQVDVPNKIWVYIDAPREEEKEFTTESHKVVFQLLRELKLQMFGDALKYKQLPTSEVKELKLKAAPTEI